MNAGAALGTAVGLSVPLVALGTPVGEVVGGEDTGEDVGGEDSSSNGSSTSPSFGSSQHPKFPPFATGQQSPAKSNSAHFWCAAQASGGGLVGVCVGHEMSGSVKNL